MSKQKWKSRHKCETFSSSCPKCNIVNSLKFATQDEIENYILNFIPERYINAKPEDFPPSITDVFSDPNESVYTCGGVGVGKTHLMACMGIVWLSYGESVLRVNYNSLLAEIKATFQDKSLNESTIYNKYSKCYRLIIEDVGTVSGHEKKETEFNRSVIFRIINNRYENMLPTYVTSNLSLNESATVFDERLTSRINSGRLIELSGKDRR